MPEKTIREIKRSLHNKIESKYNITKSEYFDGIGVKNNLNNDTSILTIKQDDTVYEVIVSDRGRTRIDMNKYVNDELVDSETWLSVTEVVTYILS